MKGIESYINLHDNLEIRLNANESYFGIDEKMTLHIKTDICNLDLNRYPEDGSELLKELYGGYAGVDKENIVVGNGSDEMIGLVIGLKIAKGKKLLTLNPDFSMYDYYVSMHSGEMVKYNTKEDGSFDIDKFIKLGKKENVDMIIFSNPNNPTGHAIEAFKITKILEAFKDKVVLVDEAYYEFFGESMIPYINRYKNLLVTRTLSKAWGLAAARIGFLIGNCEEIKKINKYKVPYNVNSLSQVVASIVLKDRMHVEKNIKEIVSEREKLYKSLKEIQENSALYIEFYPSKANYIYGRTEYKEALINGLKSRGILIRSFEKNNFRITVGCPFENNKLLQAIREIVGYGGVSYA